MKIGDNNPECREIAQARARGVERGEETSTNSSNHSSWMPVCSDYVLVWLQ